MIEYMLRKIFLKNKYFFLILVNYRGNVNIKISRNVYSIDLSLFLFSLTGKRMCQKIVPNKMQRFVLSSERFSLGFYLIDISTLDNTSKFTKKLIIK